jgi:hypothetical protein
MNIRLNEIGFRFASALLLHRGELSIGDIRALPFFSSPDESEAVIEALLKNFKVERYTKMVASRPIPEWEEIIRLKK